MAQFTTTLSEATPAKAAPVHTSSGSTTQDLAAVAGQGLQLFAGIKRQRDVQEQQQSLAGIQTDVLNLEDERNALLLEDQQLATQVQQITQDGITEEEQDVLNSLDKQRAKLTRAKRSGILNPINFQTRLNALQKSALADVSNLAIQPQINSLFTQGRSNVRSAVPSAQAQFNAQMDAKYGSGNWSGVDAGRERGRQIYLTQMKADAANDFSTFRGKESITFMNIADDHVRALRNTLNEKGALNDLDVDAYRTGINSSTQALLRSIDEAVLENRKQNLPINPEIVKQAKQRVLDNQKFYMGFLEKGQEFGDNVMMSQRLANMNTIVDEINKARNPALGQISALVAGTGSNGDLMSMAQLVSSDDSLLQGVIANLPEELRGTIDVGSLKTQAAQAVAYAIDGIDFKEAAQSGLVNNRLAAIVSGVGVKTSDNSVSIDSYLSAFEGIDFSDTESSLDLFNTPKTQNNLKKTPKGLQRLPAVAVHMLDNIKANITPGEAEFLVVQPDGSLRIEIPNDPAIRARVSRFSLYTNKLLKKYDEFLNNYAKEIGVQKEQFYRDLLPQNEEVRETEGE